MSKIFEKLLLVNKILLEKELEHYKQLQANDPNHQNLGEILLQQGVIDQARLEWLYKAEAQSQDYARVLRRQKRDKKIVEMVQRLGLICEEELATCIAEQKELKHRKQRLFLSDLFVQKGYLTPYQISKLYRKSKFDNAAQPGDSNREAMVINIPNYLRDKFLAKIAIKNEVVNQHQVEECWQAIKQTWPHHALAKIMVEKKLVSERKMRMLLEVLKTALPEKYPFFHLYMRDSRLARLLVKKEFLSPWRINKCLLAQLDKIKENEYLPLRQLLIAQGYLTPYHFDVVLQRYGELVSAEIPEIFLVPTDETRTEEKGDDVEYEIGAGISMIVEQDLDLNLNQEEVPAIASFDVEDEIDALPDDEFGDDQFMAEPVDAEILAKDGDDLDWANFFQDDIEEAGLKHDTAADTAPTAPQPELPQKAKDQAKDPA